MKHNQNEIIPPHLSIFPHPCPNSQLTSVITKDKNTPPVMIPVQKNSAVKTRCLDAVHLTLPHSVLLVTASDGFNNGALPKL